ncbi:MAG TPA: hypothetical protein VMT46_17175 [Anaerolineaceae bacterium]|nr:hypothetical protein [Anaerolineaceae bacterium]
MIYVHSPVKKGFFLNQNGQFPIDELIARGNTSDMEIQARSKESGEELSSGMGMDLSSLIEFCKQILVETGALPKWFLLGVVIDADHSRLLTFFSPSKERFFSDIYNYIKEYLPINLSMADTETVVKEFFDRSQGFRFDYKMIPLDSLLAGSMGGKVEQTDLRL